MQKNGYIRFRTYILGLYLLILPIDSSLRGIIGSISVINYIVMFYCTIRFLNLFKERIKTDNLVKCRMYFVYVLYFMISISWTISRELGSWCILSLLGSFGIFLFASIDTYSNDEYKFLRNMITFGGVVVVMMTFWNLDSDIPSRFVLGAKRTMDPNYFATGLVLVTANLMDNILNKKNVKINMGISILLILTIVMTGSRGGLLANMFVIFTSVSIHKMKQFKKLFLVFQVLMVFGFIFYFTHDLIPNWLLNRFTTNQMISDGGSGRIAIWLSNLSYFKNGNILRLIFGNGFASFPHISLVSFGVPMVAHSIYVQSLIEGGIIGLLITISLIVVAIRYAWKNNEKYVFSALVGAVIGGFFLDIHISRFFWVILFLSVCTRQNNYKKSIKKPDRDLYNSERKQTVTRY